MPNADLDIVRIGSVLAAHEVDYVMIGGMAVVLRGGNTTTGDVDLAFFMRPDNFERLADALQELNARPKRWLTSNYRLRATDFGSVWLHLESDAGDIDLIMRTPGLTYDELRTGAGLLPVEGIDIWVASSAELIRLKKTAGRDKDRLHVEELERLLELQQDDSPS